MRLALFPAPLFPISLLHKRASSRTSHALRIINPTMLSSLTLYPRAFIARIESAMPLFSFHQRCPPSSPPCNARTAIMPRTMCMRAPIRRTAAIIAISPMTTRFPSPRSARSWRERSFIKKERGREEGGKSKEHRRGCMRPTQSCEQ